MVIKKLNALCSWFLTLSLLGHLGTMSYSMLTGWYSYNVCKNLAHATALFAAIHICFSLIIVFFCNDGSDFKNYKGKNRSVIMQRASGLVIIVLLHMHVQSFGFIVSGTPLSAGNKAELIITEIIFFGAIFMHLAVSFVKSLITLGLLRSEAAEKTMNKIVYILCLVLFVITAMALTLFVFKWTGFGGE